MKILVAIANHGTKNLRYLRVLLEEYASMPFHVDRVVLSDCPKDVGPGVEVRVGCPAKNPWSLPFGHKRLFAERADDYDLFIYSEDDTLIRERNIRAFLEATSILPPDRIAGFMRYEVYASGQRSYSTVHSQFRWIPDSVEKFGSSLFARFTNEHSASYVLTREQLKRAIASGGYLVEPHDEKYDLLVSAATDPYTQCGFRKVICISQIEDFLLHHLPNQYLGRLGIGAADFERQIRALMEIHSNGRSRQELFSTETRLVQGLWSKFYYEPPREDLLAAVPPGAKRVLSVGCGWGVLEAKLVQKGIEVVGIPLDAVIGSCAQARGVKLTPPNFEEAFATLAHERFDCIILSDVLQHIHQPFPVLARAAALLSPKGRMIASVPNFNALKVWRDLLKGRIPFGAKRDFQKGLIHFTTRRMVRDWFRRSRLELVQAACGMGERLRPYARWSGGLLTEWLASDWVFVGRRN